MPKEQNTQRDPGAPLAIVVRPHGEDLAPQEDFYEVINREGNLLGSFQLQDLADELVVALYPSKKSPELPPVEFAVEDQPGDRDAWSLILFRGVTIGRVTRELSLRLLRRLGPAHVEAADRHLEACEEWTRSEYRETLVADRRVAELALAAKRLDGPCQDCPQQTRLELAALASRHFTVEELEAIVAGR